MLATITGVGIVVPLLPVYVSRLGASGLYIGLIFGAFSISRTVFLPLFGRLSDRKGRKPFIVFGLLAYALVSVAFILFPQVNQMIAIRFFQGMASAMIMPVIQAYIGDITPQGREGVVMGVFNMSLFFGLSLGPVVGGVISDRFNLQAAFGCMGLLALIGFGLCTLLLPAAHHEKVLRKGHQPTQWRVILSDRTIAGLFAFRLAHTAGISIIWGFLPVLAASEFSLTSSQIGVLIMLGVLVSGLIQAPMGYLADRISRKAMVVVGGILAGSAILCFQWADTYGLLFGVSIAFGIGGGIAIPAVMAVAVLKGSQTQSMGSVMAILTVAHSLGMLAGAVFAGIMMDWFDLRTAFRFGGIVLFGGIAIFYLSVTDVRGDSNGSAR